MYFDPIEAGKRIKAIREAKGMTQMGFAAKYIPVVHEQN